MNNVQIERLFRLLEWDIEPKEQKKMATGILLSIAKGKIVFQEFLGAFAAVGLLDGEDNLTESAQQSLQANYSFTVLLEAEKIRAEKIHKPFTSIPEGMFTIREEYLECEKEVMRRKVNKVALRTELIQLAQVVNKLYEFLG